MKLYGYIDYYIKVGSSGAGHACFCCCCAASYKRSRIDKRMASKKKARQSARKQINYDLY